MTEPSPVVTGGIAVVKRHICSDWASSADDWNVTADGLGGLRVTGRIPVVWAVAADWASRHDWALK
jgi:hypothetical protein